MGRQNFSDQQINVSPIGGVVDHGHADDLPPAPDTMLG